MKLFGSVHFGTLMKIPRTMKYNGESPMNGKILRGIIIAVSPPSSTPTVSSPSAQHTLLVGGKGRRQKKSFTRNFNWTFISVLKK